jgi:hypothetical protein
MFVREEFDWEEIRAFLEEHVTVAIVGPSKDERSVYFPRLWSGWKCRLIELEATSDCRLITIKSSTNGSCTVELIPGLKRYLESIRSQMRIVCIDISSLQHAVIMFLCKLLTHEIKPAQLFASYAQPLDYLPKSHLGDFLLSEELLGLKPVPGYVRRIRGSCIRLLAFLGFEGDRLAKIIEEMDDIQNVIPVIGFPAFSPGWQARSLRNCMLAIQRTDATDNIHKCNATSVFDAYEIIERCKPVNNEEVYALAPLGTRPHSMACAIYAAKHPECLLRYDFPIEASPRSTGILRRVGYHLSTFITP